MKDFPHGLGREQSEFDPRDYDLKHFIPREIVVPKVEANWEYPDVPLNQGLSSHCVGFGIANFGINLPTNTHYTNQDGHRFYYLCKEIDGKPLSEEGSTGRTAGKLMKDLGMIEAYAFALDMDIVKYWLLNRGPLLVGTIWTMDMFYPDGDNNLHITGGIAGGHLYMLNEWRIDSYLGVQNSWGADWGVNGKAYISADDWKKLFMYDGEAIAAVELENYRIKKPCPLVNLFNKILS